MKKISVCDFTLKQLANENSDELLFREKTAIASCVNNIGADCAELPGVKREKEDAIIYKTIASLMTECELVLSAGCSEKSIDTAWECIKTAKKPCLQIALPVSTSQMEYRFRMKEPAMLENAEKLVAYAKEKCGSVEFSALDATRAEREFLLKICSAAEKSGATRIALYDDAGIYFPEETAQLVSDVKSVCTLPVYVCLSDNINMAAAGAIAALKAGADGVKTSMTGKNVLLTEAFASVIEARGEQLGFETGLKLTEIHRDIETTLKNISSSASVISPNEAGNEKEIFLDSESTLADVSEAIKLLGYDLTAEDNGKVHKALMRVCERKSSVGAKELEALIAGYAMQAPSVYHLSSYSVTCMGNAPSMAQVTLECNGETVTGVAIGDGPIDSALRAIEQSIGYHYELDAFQIQAVTEGKEALGSTLIRLRNKGKLYSGTGLSTDIVDSSIRAYINALNKIVFEEK